MSNEKLVFKSELKSRSVEIDGKEYTLSELTGAQRAKHLTMQSPNMRFDGAGKPVGMKNFDGFESQMVALTLKENSTGKNVDIKTIEGWPANVVMTLAAEVRRLSGMEVEDEKKEEVAKNESEASA